MTVTTLFAEVLNLDDKGVKQLMRLVIDEYKMRRARQERLGMTEYRVGQLVENVDDCKTLPAGAIGKVLKINTVKMRVDFGVYRVWNIPPSMLKPAAAGAKTVQGMPLPRPRVQRVGIEMETPPELA